MADLLLGQVLRFAGDPFVEGPDAARHEPHGAVLIERRPHRRRRPGRPPCAPPTRRPGCTDYGRALISAGFIDAHVHYPQTAIIASWGKRLIDWLNSYTFPEEMRFADPAYAAEIANRYLDLRWPTAPPRSAPMPPSTPPAWTPSSPPRRPAGSGSLPARPAWTATPPRACATPRNRPMTTARRLLEKWHGVDRLSYVITPRFSPTSTPEQLAALGALWREYPDCLMQTHLSEQTDEIAWVQDLFPQSRDYLDTYEAQGLLREGARLRPRHPPDRARDATG